MEGPGCWVELGQWGLLHALTLGSLGSWCCRLLVARGIRLLLCPILMSMRHFSGALEVLLVVSIDNEWVSRCNISSRRGDSLLLVPFSADTRGCALGLGCSSCKLPGLMFSIVPGCSLTMGDVLGGVKDQLGKLIGPHLLLLGHLQGCLLDPLVGPNLTAGVPPGISEGSFELGKA